MIYVGGFSPLGAVPHLDRWSQDIRKKAEPKPEKQASTEFFMDPASVPEMTLIHKGLRLEHVNQNKPSHPSLLSCGLYYGNRKQARTFGLQES